MKKKIISIDREKKLTKFNIHSFMIETFNNIAIKRFFNLIKVIYKIPAATIILKMERPVPHPPIKNELKYSFLLLLFDSPIPVFPS